MTDIEIIRDKKRCVFQPGNNTLSWIEYVNSSFGLGLTNPVYFFGWNSLPRTTNQLVTAQIKSSRDIVGVVMDKFGRNVILTPVDKGHFIATLKAYQNAQFLSWLVTLGKKVQIITPDDLRKALSRFVSQTGCWNYYSKNVVLGECSMWKQRKPYWVKDNTLSGDESRGDGIWK